MKSIVLSFMLSMTLFLPVFSHGDAEGCKDHERIPNRISGYFIGSCESNEFSSHTVATTYGEKTIEGRKWVFEYVLWAGSASVSETFFRKNYMEALKKQGAIIPV